MIQIFRRREPAGCDMVYLSLLALDFFAPSRPSFFKHATVRISQLAGPASVVLSMTLIRTTTLHCTSITDPLPASALCLSSPHALQAFLLPPIERNRRLRTALCCTRPRTRPFAPVLSQPSFAPVLSHPSSRTRRLAPVVSHPSSRTHPLAPILSHPSSRTHPLAPRPRTRPRTRPRYSADASESPTATIDNIIAHRKVSQHSR